MPKQSIAFPLISLVIYLLTAAFIYSPKAAIAQPKTEREWYHVLGMYYSAEDGWETFQQSKASMGLPVPYSYEAFVRLPISKIDSLARDALKQKRQYDKYCESMRLLGMIPQREFFKKLSREKQEALSHQSEASAVMWPEYKNNMTAHGQTFISAKEFYKLSMREQERLYNASDGSDRSFWQWVKRDYSAKDGWTVYRDSLTALSLPLEYEEYDFINLDIEQIDKLARQARNSKDLFRKLKELCELAEKTCSYRAAQIYRADDLKKWEQEYRDRQQEWSSRILYADSCRRVGALPNWKVFESKSAKDQVEAAVLAETLANNLEEYNQLCAKLEVSVDPQFIDAPIAAQRELVTRLGDELWSQRKQTIKKVGVTVAIIVAAILVKKAYDDFQGDVAPADTTSGIAKTSSQIDRDAFAKQREAFWKTQAEQNPSKYTDRPDNLNRMKSGKAPIGNDGFSMELHHPRGDPNAVLIPMTRTEHRLGDNYAKNHLWLFDKKK